MNAQDIVNQLRNHKGQNQKLTWTRPAHTRKAFEGMITKTTTAIVRAGIDYANLASIKQGIESGERDEVGPLPWGEWIEFPFTIGHKGNEYVRLYPSSFAGMPKTTTWAMNGKPVSFADVAPYLLASELPKDDDDKPACFCLNCSNTDIKLG